MERGMEILKAKKYVSGRISVCFIVNSEDVENVESLLLDNQFDTLVIGNSANGVMIPLEAMTLDMDEIVILGDDEDTDELLA